MIEKWWVILYVLAKVITLGIHLGRDGETRETKYSGGGALIATVIAFTLAWLGGVFECFK